MGLNFRIWCCPKLSVHLGDLAPIAGLILWGCTLGWYWSGWTSGWNSPNVNRYVHETGLLLLSLRSCIAEVCEPNSTDEGEPQGWYPFENHTQFDVAEFLYRCVQMSAGNVDSLLDLWESSLVTSGDHTPFADCKEMYEYIDAIPYGKVQWQSFMLLSANERDSEAQLLWMEDPQVVWYREPLAILWLMIANPAFNGEFDYVPYHEYINGNHHFRDFMSGDWAWKQAVHDSPSFLADVWPDFKTKLAADPENHGAFFVPIILGSDKTTVSVATGNNEYWPLYLSIGNLRNSARCAHKDGLVIIGFLSSPKGTNESSIAKP